MIDYLQSALALTLSILIHTCIAFFGDIQIAQSVVGKSGPLRVTVTNLSQSAEAESSNVDHTQADQIAADHPPMELDSKTTSVRP